MPRKFLFSNLQETVTRPFRHEAESRGLFFDDQVDPQLRSITTDSKRLQQVLKNLLSNAFKFTEHGGVRLRIAAVTGGWTGGSSGAAARARRGGVRGDRHRHRHSGRKSSASSSRRSSRPMPAPAANMAAPASAWRSAANCRNLLGGEIQLRSKPGVGQHLHAVSAADLRRAASAARACSRRPAGRVIESPNNCACASPEQPIEQVPDDRQDPRTRRSRCC